MVLYRVLRVATPEQHRQPRARHSGHSVALMATIRAAQYGTKHSHAAGKIRAMRASPEIELVGVFEPDPTARAALSKNEAYAGLRLYATKEELLNDETIVLVASEGSNDESLEQTRELVAAGKHVWYAGC